jgi:hypothetical protein
MFHQVIAILCGRRSLAALWPVLLVAGGTRRGRVRAAQW